MKDPRYRGMLLWVIGALLFIIVNGLLTNKSKQEESTTEMPAQESYRISHTGADRAAVLSDYDATEQYMFFSYSENTAVVDAYDQSGQYAFSIHVEGKDNGGVIIRCENNMLYIHSKYENVFVFDGETLVSYYPEKDAEALGYDFFWFYDPSENVVLRGSRLLWLDADGNTGEPLAAPSSVIGNYYRQFSVFYGMIFIGIVCLCRSLIQKRQGKARNPTSLREG